LFVVPTKQWVLSVIAVFMLLCSLMVMAQTPEKNTLIAASFGDVPPPEKITRVIAAGPVADILLISIAPEKLIGISGHHTGVVYDKSKKYFSEMIRNVPSTGRIAGRGTTFPFEKLVALKPDVIIDVGNVGDTYVSTAKRANEQTGAPFVLVDGRLLESARQIREVAALLGANERGVVLANFADQVLSDAARVRQDTTKKKVRVFYGRGADGLETGLAQSIHTEAIDLVGADNVAAAAGEKISSRVSLEQLIQWKPDMIVTLDANFYETLKKGGVWGQLDAVKNKRFYLIPSVPFGWIDHPPSINRLLGVIWMQRTLYPETMSEELFHAKIQAYFKLFYGYDLSDDELKQILNPS
jgi:iron complex transport system substrate-binding protein